jgi:hypothetical protein
MMEQETVIYHLDKASTHLEKAFTQKIEHFPVELAQKWYDFFTLLIGNIIHSEADKREDSVAIKAKEIVFQDGK